MAVSENVDFRETRITTNTDKCYIMIKKAIHCEHVLILNVEPRGILTILTIGSENI
jgi:hypothetical protein